jgi:hypothetical protein
MITLSIENRLVKVDSWDEIESLPGFARDINPVEQKLDSIIGRYVFKDMIRCGLSDCHTPHARGYIVVTKDGCKTNIGKDCGKTYFGVDFETLSKKLDRDITESENRERLWSFSFRIDDLEKKIRELRSCENGADWVYKLTRPLIDRSKGCPEEVVRRISSMVKTRNNALSVQRQATKREIEELEVIQNRKLSGDYVIDEQVAEILGIEALYPENDLREILVINLEDNIKRFKEENIAKLTYNELKAWVKWVDSVNGALDKASIAMQSGRILLNIENLEPFYKVLNTHGDKKKFRDYLRRLNPN